MIQLIAGLAVKSLGKCVAKIAATFATEKMIEWLIMESIKAGVKSTKTDIDDKILEQYLKSRKATPAKTSKSTATKKK